ncbi:MAG: MFS transporter [Thalassolituus maritimus]|uniref:MFS transporter, DHA1 family, inner membrane transport protein n=1 Tax=Thalassolituus maritimus TaxID=484498 RepID=A0A1N7KWQ2_9GAMM|nr:MFS transporter [Thalassolituus maritimus]TPD55580.1 MAG: MFS transporter [Thalassolituus maritimus]SIS65916.1 MFS transporter, DHA1 family, inner membrane transport protein [Thalassolituus maritimus]
MKLNFPLLALALGAFGIGVTEFSPMGMLSVIANDLDVSIPSAGMLISAYAFGVVIGAPIMTLGFARMSRRNLLLLSMSIFTLGNLISALADTYSTLMIGRIVTSFNHGAFFGIGAVVATKLVPPEKQASAVAAVFSGLTIANIGGVPLATYVSETIGWRTAFMGMTVIGVATLIALRVSLPKMEADKSGSIRNELKVLSKGPVLFALLLTVVGSSSMFTVFSYISPILLEETEVGTLFVTSMLILYGVGLAVGNWLSGRFADRNLTGTLIISMAATMLLLALFAATMQVYWLVPPLIFLWGISSFAVVPPLQALVVTEASDAPNLASSMNIAAFNLGNALGAALGGVVIYLGLGLPAVALAGAATSAAGLILVVIYQRSHSKVPDCDSCDA